MISKFRFRRLFFEGSARRIARLPPCGSQCKGAFFPNTISLKILASAAETSSREMPLLSSHCRSSRRLPGRYSITRILGFAQMTFFTLVFFPCIWKFCLLEERGFKVVVPFGMTTGVFLTFLKYSLTRWMFSASFSKSSS